MLEGDDGDVDAGTRGDGSHQTHGVGSSVAGALNVIGGFPLSLRADRPQPGRLRGVDVKVCRDGSVRGGYRLGDK